MTSSKITVLCLMGKIKWVNRVTYKQLLTHLRMTDRDWNGQQDIMMQRSVNNQIFLPDFC